VFGDILPILVVVGVVTVIIKTVNDQRKRDANTSVAGTSRVPGVARSLAWPGVIDAKGADALWPSDTFVRTDGVEFDIFMTPTAYGLEITPTHYRPGVSSPAVTVAWEAVVSASRGLASATVQLNLAMLGEQDQFTRGEVSVLRCFGDDGSTLVTEINKRLYGQSRPYVPPPELTRPPLVAPTPVTTTQDAHISAPVVPVPAPVASELIAPTIEVPATAPATPTPFVPDTPSLVITPPVVAPPWPPPTAFELPAPAKVTDDT
jgi:hypothetical protein